MILRALIVFLPILIFSGCSIERLAVRSTATIVENSFAAVEEEEDLVLAESSIAANLKLLEGLLKSDPANRNLLLLATRGFTSYAYGFVEENDPERAKVFYYRARDYGMQVLRANTYFERTIDGYFEDFEESLNKLHGREIPFLFWTAYAWGGAIMLDPGSPVSLAALPRVEAMMGVVLERDESYFYAGPHLFFGMIFSSKPVMFGGDPERGKDHFERGIELTDGKFLLMKVMYAQTYAVQTLNRELYEELLRDVIDTPADIIPEQRLINTLARERAVKLLDRADELF